MAKLLKQTTTGHIYMWTENLASRSDMEVYYPTPALASEPENTSENPVNTSADEPETDLEVAKAAFRRQVTKLGRKPSSRTSGAP